MPKVGNICCVPGCDNAPTTTKKFTKPLRFYKFPNGGPFTAWREHKRQQWIDAIGIRNEDGTPWQPTKNTIICSAHFVGGEKSENPLGPSYIPTLFPTLEGDYTVSESPGKAAKIRRKKGKKITETGLNQTAKTNAKITYASSLVQRVVPELKVFTLKIAYPTTKSVKCQANLPDRDNQLGNIAALQHCFICNMKVEDNVCNAEVQVTIPSKIDQAVGSNKPYIIDKKDVACGPNLSDRQNSRIASFQGINSIKTDAELMDFSGITSATFELILSLLPDISGKKLDPTNKLLVFLMRLKLGLTYPVLAVLFSVHRSTVVRASLEIINCLPPLLEEYIYWPSKAEVHKNLPAIFKPNYSNCRVIIDCVEIRVETPTGNDLRKSMYSSSKRAFTIKFLVAFTPNGLISFKSKYYGGATSNEFIAKDSGFLDFIEPGDLVIADNRFPKIELNIEEKKAAFTMPPCPEQLKVSPSEIEEARKATAMRNHIERCIKRIQIFSVLSLLPTDMLPHADSIIHICCALVNLQLLPVSQGK